MARLAVAVLLLGYASTAAEYSDDWDYSVYSEPEYYSDDWDGENCAPRLST